MSLAPRRKPAVLFVFITLVLDVIGIGLVIPILPKLVEQFEHGDIGAASHQYGALAALYSLMQFLFAPLLGSLSDRFGRRRVILLSLLGSGLDYFLFAIAPNVAWLFVARLISGITGANYAAAMAYIADITPPEKRAANFGLMGAAFGIGFITGPAAGGFLGDIDLRLPFVVAGGLTLANWLYGWFVLPESLAPENRRPFSWQRANPVGSMLVLQQHPVVLGLVGTYFLCHVAHQCFPATWVLYTTHRYGWSTREIGLSLAAVGLMSGAVQAGLTGAIVRKLGERRTAIFGMGIAAISLILYGAAPQGWMIYLILLFGSFGGVTGPAVQGLISRTVGAREQGLVQGALASLASIAGIVGPPVATSLFAHFMRPDVAVRAPGAAFFFSAFLVFVGLLLALRSFRKTETRDSVPAPARQVSHQTD